MKRFIRNTLIILLYLTGLPWFRRWWIWHKHGPLVRVVVFHEIKNEYIQQFRRLLQLLKQHYNVLTPQEFHDREWSEDQPNILLTFDDGYKSWMHNVIPILQEGNLSGVFFINAGTVGSNDHLTWNDIEQIARLFEIGGHTYSHANLAVLKQDAVRKEIENDKRIIEQVVGRSLRFFAYPFGARSNINAIARSVVEQAGYRRAFSILPGFNASSTDSFLFHRDSLQPTMSHLLIRAWLAGSYDWLKTTGDYLCKSKE